MFGFDGDGFIGLPLVLVGCLLNDEDDEDDEDDDDEDDDDDDEDEDDLEEDSAFLEFSKEDDPNVDDSSSFILHLVKRFTSI